VLVHCQAGVSRSPSVVVAYLMSRRQMNLADALELTRKRRWGVLPNPGGPPPLAAVDAGAAVQRGPLSEAVETRAAWESLSAAS
jgi:predicted protein tyrosine phosphatase